VAVLALLFLAGSSSSSFAGLILTLGTGNSAISGYTPPFGTVDVTRIDATHATIVFTAGSNATNKYLFGGAQAVDINVNGPFTASITAASFPNAGLATAFTIGDLTSGGSNNADGFGTYNQTFDNFDGATHAFSSATISLTLTSGSWATNSDVLTPNSNGSRVAAHIFVFDSSYGGVSGNALNTGYAAESGATVTTPEPATIVILASGLPVGLLALRRRFRGYPATE
jgi:hypothetical protein